MDPTLYRNLVQPCAALVPVPAAFIRSRCAGQCRPWLQSPLQKFVMISDHFELIQSIDDANQISIIPGHHRTRLAFV